ncbi:DUF1840 domain-containing protein [Azohydromonas caseinilytica]|nr:DUF1840 domain-containing protein [Azohydromonas caseinilytica]
MNDPLRQWAVRALVAAGVTAFVAVLVLLLWPAIDVLLLAMFLHGQGLHRHTGLGQGWVLAAVTLGLLLAGAGAALLAPDVAGQIDELRRELLRAVARPRSASSATNGGVRCSNRPGTWTACPGTGPTSREQRLRCDCRHRPCRRLDRHPAPDHAWHSSSYGHEVPVPDDPFSTRTSQAMLYKFKSKAAGDVVMLGQSGDQILRLLGREPAPQGIFEVADMPALRAALQQAVDAEEAERAQAQAGAAAEGRQLPAQESVGLRQRVWPLLEMMKYAQAANEPIVWGV